MLSLSALVRNSLLFLIVFVYTVNGLGVSSKLNFDDSESESPNGSRNIQARFKSSKAINDPFTDSVIKINKDQITDINCRSTECEITVKPIQKANGDDQVVTKVNIQVETKVNKKDEDDNKKRKNITITDVPIFRGKPDFVQRHYYNTKIPNSFTNVPIVRTQSTPTTFTHRVHVQNPVYITPKPVFVPLTNPTYSSVSFDQNYLPNSMWITRNINTNPKPLTSGFVPSTSVQWGTGNYRPLVTSSDPGLNQWFYPTVPKATNDLNKYYNDVRLYLENPFPTLNYPGNVQVQHKGDDCNCDLATNQATDKFFRALHSDNDKKKVKQVDGKLEELDS